MRLDHRRGVKCWSLGAQLTWKNSSHQDEGGRKSNRSRAVPALPTCTQSGDKAALKFNAALASAPRMARLLGKEKKRKD